MNLTEYEKRLIIKKLYELNEKSTTEKIADKINKEIKGIAKVSNNIINKIFE